MSDLSQEETARVFADGQKSAQVIPLNVPNDLQQEKGGTAIIRRHVDLNLVALLVTLYDFVILSLTSWLAILPRPILLVSSYIVTVVSIVLAVFCAWAWMRSRRTASIERFVTQSFWQRAATILGGGVVLFGIPLAVVRYAVGANDPLFAWVLAWGIMAVSGTLGLRIGLAYMIARWRKDGALRQTIAIVGSGDLAVRLVIWLRQACSDSIEIIGVFDDRQRYNASHVHFSNVLMGTTDDLVRLSKETSIDRIIVALPHAAEQRLTWILRKLKRIPVDICLAPDQAGFAAAVIRPGDYSGLPVLKIYGRPLDSSHRLAKASVDRLLAIAALIFHGPLLLAIAAMLKYQGNGPVLAAEPRLGFGTRIIELRRFNCTVESTLGRFLYRSGLDRFPRLLDVLQGSLSFVGPRAMPDHLPIADRFDHEMVQEYALRHRMKPGLTGWAQINGYGHDLRNSGDFFIAVQHDLHYIDHWSLGLDLKIMAVAALRTVFKSQKLETQPA